MLMRSEPFTEVNRLAQQLFGTPVTGTWTRPAAMPCDAYRNGDEFVIAFDLPGVDPDAIDIDVERLPEPVMKPACVQAPPAPDRGWPPLVDEPPPSTGTWRSSSPTRHRC